MPLKMESVWGSDTCLCYSRCEAIVGNIHQSEWASVRNHWETAKLMPDKVQQLSVGTDNATYSQQEDV